MIVKGKGYCLYALENGIPNSYRNKWVLLLYGNVQDGVTDLDAFYESFANMLVRSGVEVGDIILINDVPILPTSVDANAQDDPVLSSYIVVPMTESAKFASTAYSQLIMPKGLMFAKLTANYSGGVN